jgi:hypothetical protein
MRNKTQHVVIKMIINPPIASIQYQKYSSLLEVIHILTNDKLHQNEA